MAHRGEGDQRKSLQHEYPSEMNCRCRSLRGGHVGAPDQLISFLGRGEVRGGGVLVIHGSFSI